MGSAALASGCVAGGGDGDGAGVIGSRHRRHGVWAAHASDVLIDALSARSSASACYAAAASYRRRRWADLEELLRVASLPRAALEMACGGFARGCGVLGEDRRD